MDYSLTLIGAIAVQKRKAGTTKTDKSKTFGSYFY
jgi:hypothetical protein